MGDRFLITGGGTLVSKATNIWNALSGMSAGDGLLLTDGDVCRLDAASGALTISQDPGSPAEFSAISINTTDYTSLVTMGELGRFASAILAGGALDHGGYALNLVGQLDLDGGSLVAAGSDSSMGAFDMTAGTMTGAAAVSVAGSITIGSTLAHTGVWTMSASGTYTAGAADRRVTLVVPTDVTCTPAAAGQYIKGLSGAGTIASLGYFLVNNPADDFWTFTGTYSPTYLSVYSAASRSTGSGISLPAATTATFQGLTGTTMTMDGQLSAPLAVVTIMGLNAGNQVSTLVLNSAGANVKGFFIGSDGNANLDGTLTLAGNVVIGTSGIDIGSATANILNFGSACVALAGTIEATGATCTNVASFVIGGTVNNVNISTGPNLLHIRQAVAGSGNINVTEVATWREFRVRHGFAA